MTKSGYTVEESWNMEDYQLLGQVVEYIQELDEEVTYEEMEEYWKTGWEGTPNRIKKLLRQYYTDPEIWEYEEE